MPIATPSPDTHDAERLRRAGGAAFVLGLALSGFFDGILLHQVLQWHHFLSLVPGRAFQDIRVQIYADGLFHIFVYCLSLLGLFLLWRARRELGRPGSGRRIAGGALLGFGVWNIVDVGFFHWILGIHRIRVNVANPMAYDLAWFVGLGIIVALAGLLAGRWKGRLAEARGGGAAISLVLALLLSAPIANIPAAGGNTLIVMRPGARLAAVINAAVERDGRLVLIDPAGSFLLVSFPREPAYLSLVSAGGLIVTRSPLLAGCLAFSKAG